MTSPQPIRTAALSVNAQGEAVVLATLADRPDLAEVISAAPPGSIQETTTTLVAGVEPHIDHTNDVIRHLNTDTQLRTWHLPDGRRVHALIRGCGDVGGDEAVEQVIVTDLDLTDTAVLAAVRRVLDGVPPEEGDLEVFAGRRPLARWRDL